MLTFKTTKLQEMVSKAFKGVGNNKLKPITELISLRLTGGLFTLTTTDGDNYMYITESVENDGDFYAVVQANQFARLVSKITSEDVSLSVENNCLEVYCNGNYKIPVEIDASTGTIVEYTDPVAKLQYSENEKIGAITVQDISTILRALKPALATTLEIPQYVNYYVGDVVLATDTNMASCYKKAITSTPVLVSAVAMDMLSVYTGTNALSIYKVSNRLLFKGDNFILFGYAMPGVDEFAVESINMFVETQHPSMCKIPKQTILQALDRLSLFVSDFDEDKIGTDFTSEGLRLSSKQSDSIEVVPYTSADNLQEMKSCMYLNMLSSHIKAQTGDSIDIHFGEPNSIKLVDDACDVTSVICLVV